uniref:Uncharacterized protein n=1 Tax=Hordeum vulgare subsp. vulgare TaxID=112509 RepID=A0A8I7BK86_HORVV
MRWTLAWAGWKGKRSRFYVMWTGWMDLYWCAWCCRAGRPFLDFQQRRPSSLWLWLVTVTHTHTSPYMFFILQQK